MSFCPRIDGTKARNPRGNLRRVEILEAPLVEPPQPMRRTKHWVFRKRFAQPPDPTALDVRGEIVTASNAPTRTTNAPRAKPRKAFCCFPAAVFGRFPMQASVNSYNRRWNAKKQPSVTATVWQFWKINVVKNFTITGFRIDDISNLVSDRCGNNGPARI